MIRSSIRLIVILAIALIAGCNSEPPLYTVKGKVTLGGKPYNRLLVYLRPLKGEANKYTLGVGETDASGNLSLRSTAGGGVAAGEYGVAFSCIGLPAGSPDVDLTKDKVDDNQFLKVVELVPERFLDEQTSNVTFTVKASDNNEFVFDIPAQ